MLLNIFNSHLHNFQVTCEYLFEHGAAVPLRVHTVVISLQHTDDVTLDVLRKEVMERIILDVIPEEYRDDETIYYINPCGKFVIGGPMVRLFECLNVRYIRPKGEHYCTSFFQKIFNQLNFILSDNIEKTNAVEFL